jgi:hypothetical protein
MVGSQRIENVTTRINCIGTLPRIEFIPSTLEVVVKTPREDSKPESFFEEMTDLGYKYTST